MSDNNIAQPSLDVAELNAQNSISQSEALAAILRQLAEGVIVTDRAGRITFVNQAAARIHGVARLDVEPDAYSETYHLFTEEGRPYPSHELPLARAVLNGETVTDARWRIRRPDGSEVLAVGSARPVLDAHGEPMGAVLTFRDDTERDAAERALRESEARLRTLTDNLPSGMVYQITMRRDGSDRRFTFVSQSHVRLTGVPAEAAMADPSVPYGLILPEFRPALAAAEADAIRELSHFDVEVPFRRADTGEVRWSRIVSAPREMDDGSLVWDGIQIDVTDRKAAEDALRANEAQQALLLGLLRGQRETGDPNAIMQAASEAVGRFLRTGRVGFFEMADDQTLRFGISWTDGTLEPLVGLWEAANIGTRYLSEVRAGRTLGIADTLGEPLTAGSKYGEIGARSIIGAPIVRNGCWHAGLYVNHSEVREWTAHEVALVRAVADQTWDAVQRARAIAALRDSEEQLRLATEAAEVGLWDLDVTTATLYWPARVKAMFGISPDIPISMADYYNGLHPDDRDGTTAAFAAALDPNKRALYDVEYRTIGKEDGVIRWVAAKGRAQFDGNNNCVRVLGTAIDITGRKRTEEALRELNETLESRVAERTAERDRVWRNSRDLLVVVGADGIFRAVNPAWTEILGHDPDEVVGRSFLEFVWPEDADLTQSGLDSASAARDLTNFENRFTHKDGTPRWISWHTSVEGNLIYAYGRHITVEKEAAAELAQAQEALRQSQKMEAVGQLTGGVAHDFNNLLTIIRSSTDLLRRPDLTEDRRRRYIDAIADTVDRASKLTGQLLAFARRQALRPEVFDVVERVGAIMDMLRTILGSRIQIATDLACDRCFVETDGSQLETALVNIALNARDAMDGEGRLTIRVEAVSHMPAIPGHRSRAGAFVAVSLTDTGSGITPDKLPHIFEPFFTTKEVGKGTGLGLSQVYGFAKQSGGDVDVQSEVGRGTTFTLYLPRVQTVPVEAQPPARQVVHDDAGRGRRVLVVEDNIEVGRFSTQLLQDLGYQTTWAASADEALRLLEQAQDGFDAVFSDVVMPGMSGVELGQEIRVRHPGLPVVLTSGYSDVLAEEGRHGFELLQKPYAVEELSRVLRRVMQSRVYR